MSSDLAIKTLKNMKINGSDVYELHVKYSVIGPSTE